MINRQQRYSIACDVDGMTYHGNYWVAGMILVVSTATGGTSTQLAGRNPDELAKFLLAKMARASGQPKELSGLTLPDPQ